MRDAGFAGRLAIHPAQVPVIHEVFTPSASAVERSHRIVALYEAATSSGQGVVVDDHGRMMDEAIVRAARRALSAFPEHRDR